MVKIPLNSYHAATALGAVQTCPPPRIKRINGGRLSSRTFGAQQNEAATHIKIANRNMTLARPLSVGVR